MDKLLKPSLVRDFFLLVVLTAFAGFVFTDDLASRSSLYWDNGQFYSFFWNQLDSLNRFGEFAWWFPANQGGWPAYYYSILGDLPILTPGFAVLGSVSWLMGQLGLRPDSFYGFYLVYFAYLVPLMANLGAYLVGRQLLKSRAALAFAMILFAFSPGMMLNMSDVGFLEPLAYSLYFFAAWIYFLRHPGEKKAFYNLAFTVCLLALSIGYPFILWNALFVPMMLLLTTFVPLKNWQLVLSAVKSRSWKEWGMLAGLSLLCALPAVITFTQTGELIRSTLGQQFYDIRTMNMGNPLEFLLVSLPHFGFEWVRKGWTVLPGLQGYHISSIYMGLLVLPLAVAALIYAGRVFRFRMLLVLVFLFGVATLSAHSPLFNLLMKAVRPFQSQNHYSDLLFRGGSFQVFILLAAMGFEFLILRRSTRIRSVLPWLVLANTAVCTLIYIATFGEGVLGESSFGLMVFLSVVLLVSFLWIKQSKKVSVFGVTGLLLITLIDVGTFNYISMRKTVETSSRVAVRPEQMAPGSTGIMPMGDYADSILVLKPLYEMRKAGMPLSNLEKFRIYTKARLDTGDSLEQRVQRETKLFQEKSPVTGAILLDASVADLAEFKPFLMAGDEPANATLSLDFQSYNELKLRVDSSKPGLLFIGDGFSPYWKAQVNGEPVPIARALFNFKAIPLPAGASQVELRFSPPLVPWAIAGAYAALIFLFFRCVFLNIKSFKPFAKKP